jgi:hypothetical protein
VKDLKEPTIRPWRPGDINQIKFMIKQLLTSQLKYGNDILPTNKNINHFWEMGLEFSRNGEPTMVVELPDHRLVSYLQCGPILDDLDLAYKTMFLYGTYTLPSQESQGWFLLQIREAGAAAVRLGYKMGKTLVYLPNRRPLELAFAGDSWPLSVNLVWLPSLYENDSGAAKREKICLG